jgi:hypothetical protein
MEDQSIFEHFEVWGQPRAWTDELIASWSIDFIHEQFGQSVVFADCLSSQWSPSVTLRAWLKGIIWAPMAPDVTSFLQEPDTHEHSQLKSLIRGVKSELHFALETEWKEASKTTRNLKYPNCWGPYECLHVIGKSLERFKQNYPNVPLQGLQATQMLRVRPTLEGTLEMVSGQESWSESTHPSRGITPKLCAKRDEIIKNWPNNIPPEPNWKLLDGEGFFQADNAPEQMVEGEEPLELAFGDLELTAHQKIMLVPPEARLKTLLFPASLKRRALFQKHNRKNRWGEKFTGHFTSKQSKKWRKRASEQDGQVKLDESSLGMAKVAPRMSLAKLGALVKQQSKDKAKSKARRKEKTSENLKKNLIEVPISIYMYI